MNEDEKECPYCKEIIKKDAIKCKHCGEFLSDKRENYSQNKIEATDVNHKWKERFKAVELICVDGKWWQGRQDYKNKTLKERWKISNALYKDFGSIFAAFFFGTLYYLFKGMWLKAIIYSIILMIFCFIIESIVPSLTKCTYFIPIFAVLAPYDYYRLKVLGKQW